MKAFVLALALAAFAVSAASGAASLKGTHKSLAAQNIEANREHLSRLHEKQLTKFKKAGLLVPLPHNQGLAIDPRLQPKYRWVRGDTRAFLLKLGAAHYQKFHVPLVITSAVRSIERQQKLTRVNPNAAKGRDGLSLSAHLTGAANDITKKSMTHAEVDWMRKRLLLNERVGCVEATEEHVQPTFHIMVYDKCFGRKLKSKTKRFPHKQKHKRLGALEFERPFCYCLTRARA